jgi:hypothetical protein
MLWSARAQLNPLERALWASIRGGRTITLPPAIRAEVTMTGQQPAPTVGPDPRASRIVEICRTITQQNVESDLVRTGDLGSKFSFEQARITFERIKKFATEIEVADFSGLPDTALQVALQQPLESLSQALNKVKQWTPVRQGPQGVNFNPEQDRKNIVAEVTNSFDSLYRNAAPIIAFCWFTSTGAVERIQELGRKAEAASASAEKSSEQAASAAAAAQVASTQVGIENYAGVFVAEAAMHDGAAKRWLGGAFAFGAAAAIAVGWFFIDAVSRQGVGAVFSFGTARAAVVRLAAVFVLLWLMAWASRFYRAHRHNAVVNRHRHNALRSFRAFVDGTADGPTKDAIRLQATTAVFSPQQTGYLQSETEQESLVRSLSVITSTIRQPNQS